MDLKLEGMVSHRNFLLDYTDLNEKYKTYEILIEAGCIRTD